MPSDHDSQRDLSRPSGEDSASQDNVIDLSALLLHGAAAHEELDDSFARPDWPPGTRPIPTAPQYVICRTGDEGGFIGEGGQASIWAASDDAGKLVVIKLVRDTHRERVKTVLQRIKGLSHPNVIQIIDGPFDLEQGLAFVMPRAKHSLRRYVECLMWKGNEPLDDKLLSLLTGAAAGIDFLTSKGIYHRDIKPDNLLEFDDQRVVVGDLDLMLDANTAIASGSFAGTEGYTAAEAQQGLYTSRSDQVGLARAYVSLRTGHVDGKIDDPKEAAIVAKACNANPFDRYPSCTAFIQELGNLTLAIPVDIQAEIDKGDVLDADGRHAEAAVAYEHAVQLAKNVGKQKALVKARIELGEALSREETGFGRAKEVLDECLADLKGNQDLKSRSTVLYLLGHIAICEGRIQEGKDLSRESLEIARTDTDHFQEGLCLLGTAHAEEMFGNLPEAHRLLDDAATVFRKEYREGKGKEKSRAAINLAGTFSNKAALYEHEGKAEDMLACLTEAEDLVRANDHLDNLARVLVSKCRALFAKSKWDEGLKALDEARDIFSRSNNIHWLLICHDIHARFAFQKRDTKTALAVCDGAIAVAAEHGSPKDQVQVLGQTAALCRRSGLDESAATHHADAKRIAMQHGLNDLLVDLLLDEADLRRGDQQRREDDDEGKRIVHEALELLESLLVRCQVKGRRADYMSRIGELHGRLSDLAEASSWFEQALRNFEEIGDAGGIADCLSHLAAAAREGGDHIEAIRLMETLLERSKGKPLHHFQAGAHHDLVALKLSQGDIAGARKHFDCATAICAGHPMTDVEEALRDTRSRLESAEQSRRPPASDMPTMIRELRTWTARYPTAADAILAFWYHCFSSQLWANCRAQVGVKFLVRASTVHQFDSFVSDWRLFGDLFIYAASFPLKTERGIDVFPWHKELLVPPTLNVAGIKGHGPLSDKQSAQALIATLQEIPYFLTLLNGTTAAFPEDKLVIVGRRYRVPDEIREFMLGTSVDELIVRQVIAMPVGERADDASLIHDMCVAWENRLLPVHFGSLPGDKDVSLERSMRLQLPQDPTRGSSRMRHCLLRFVAEVATDCDTALANLAEELPACDGNGEPGSRATFLHILRFTAGPVQVCHPVLVVPG